MRFVSGWFALLAVVAQGDGHVHLGHVAGRAAA
jgi:hypothetical protein